MANATATVGAAIEQLRKEYQSTRDISWGKYLEKRQELLDAHRDKPAIKALVPVAVKPAAKPANDGIMAAWMEIK